MDNEEKEVIALKIIENERERYRYPITHCQEYMVAVLDRIITTIKREIQ